MERIFLVLLFLVAGLGLGLALASPGNKRQHSTPPDDERPWRAVSPQTAAAILAAAALLSLGVLALAGPILAAAAGLLIFEIAVLILDSQRTRRLAQVHDETLVLAETVTTETALGTPLPDALRGYVRRHAHAHGSARLTTSLAGEVQRLILDPLAGGETLVAVLNRLAEGPRYPAYPTLHRLLRELARAARSRLTPEETEHTLRTFLDTAEMIDEVQRELAVDVTQTRYTRWAVIAIIGGAVLFMASVMPDARQHWLHDLVGQVTMLLVSLFTALAIALGERLAKLKGWRF
jgi:hypothetical protein